MSAAARAMRAELDQPNRPVRAKLDRPNRPMRAELDRAAEAVVHGEGAKP
jgi:hypothetical protein